MKVGNQSSILCYGQFAIVDYARIKNEGMNMTMWMPPE